jgi:hypothetical protein
MIERIQFWGVLLWMIAMLIMAGFAVRAVWSDATRSSDDATPKDDPTANPDSATSGSNPSGSKASDVNP